MSAVRKFHHPLRLALALALLVFVFATTMLTPRLALADSTRDAEALMEQGRKLLADGKVAEACASFEKSQKVLPDAGTLLQLGNCYQRDGRTASAWETFRDAITAAHDSGQADRERFARERAAFLEHDVARLTISLTQPAASIQGLTVARDMKTLTGTDFGTATPIDPGRHTISARAPGKKSWSAIVEITRTGGSREPTLVEIPMLEDVGPADSALPAEALGPPSSSTTTTTTTAEPAPNSTLFTTGVVLGGTAVVVSSIAIGFALSAQSKEDDLEALTKSRGTWSSEYQRTYDDGSSAATAATVLFVAGGLMLAVGATLMLVNWPNRQASSSSPKSSTNTALMKTSWSF
jgi:hypothetical protein